MSNEHGLNTRQRMNKLENISCLIIVGRYHNISAILITIPF